MDRELSLWKDLASLHLNRSGVRRVAQLRSDLLAVDCGLKPALLLDFTVPDTSALYSFLEALKRSRLLQSPLQVVSIESDLLVINATSCVPGGAVRSASEFIFQSQPLFVNISADLPNPQIIPANSASLKPTINCFLDMLQRIKDCSFGTGVGLEPLAVQTLNGDSGSNAVNPSTLFGLFLGYPAIYYYDMSLESQDNCLSMVPLRNFVLKGTAVNHDCPPSRNRASQTKTKSHTVFSFSVPEMIYDDAVLEQIINLWLEQRKNVEGWSNIFSDLQLETCIIKLPKVCL